MLGVGRILMIAMAIPGNLHLFAGPSILKGTTISGAMVMGLAPIFLFHFLPDVPRLSFHLAFWLALLGGLLYAFRAVPIGLPIGSGNYAVLLGINVYGLLACTGLYLLPVGLRALTARQRPLLSPLPEVHR